MRLGLLIAATFALAGCVASIDMGCSEETPCVPPEEDAPPKVIGEVFLYNTSSVPENGPRICAITTPCADLDAMMLPASERYIDGDLYTRDVSFLEACDDSSFFLEGEQVLSVFFDGDITGCDITIQELEGETPSEGWNAIVCAKTGNLRRCSNDEFSISSFPEGGSTTFRIER